MEDRRHIIDAVRMQLLVKAREIAAATPDSRNRYVDALRALSILVVVFGHWLMAAPELVDGALRVGHVVEQERWAQWATWLLQVMPVFFFVGGYSNAVGWRSARMHGRSYAEWLRDRLRRLTLPVLPLLVFWTVAATAAVVFGAAPDLVRTGSQAAFVPVWFLATYVGTVALAPVTLAAWERWGWVTVAALAVMAGVVDVVAIGFGVGVLAWTNYLFVWNAVHCLGYAWADGRIGGRGTRLATAAAGFAGLAALVAAFPYPLAMVGIDSTGVTNSNPPRVTLVLLALFQFGLVTSVEAGAHRVLRRMRPWTAVVAVGSSIMTLFLWHLTAMVVVVAAQLALGGVGLRLRAAGAAWWATRPLLLAVLVVVTGLFMLAFLRFERPHPDRRPAPPAWRPIAGVVLLCAGLGALAAGGVVVGGTVSYPLLALPVAGMAIGGVLGGGTAPSGRPLRRVGDGGT